MRREEEREIVDIEEQSVCAFFDVLGTRDIMLGNDTLWRQSLVNLVRQISEQKSDCSAGVENLGPALVMAPAAQVTTFSDNVAISFPTKSLGLSGTLGGKPHRIDF